MLSKDRGYWVFRSSRKTTAVRVSTPRKTAKTVKGAKIAQTVPLWTGQLWDKPGNDERALGTARDERQS